MEEAEALLGDDFVLGQDWNDIFEKITHDSTGTGRIDFQDFFTAAADPTITFSEKNIENIFAILDENKDKKFDFEDFINIFPKKKDEDKSHKDQMRFLHKLKWKQFISKSGSTDDQLTL